MDRPQSYTGCMNSREILSANIKAIKAAYELSNLKLAKRAGIGTGTVSRALLGQVALDIDTLQSIAEAFHLQTWQLLCPGLDPKNPCVIPAMTPAERDLYNKLKTLIAERG